MFSKKLFMVVAIIALIIMTQGLHKEDDLERDAITTEYSAEYAKTMGELAQHASMIKQYEEYLSEERAEEYVSHISYDMDLLRQRMLMSASAPYSRVYDRERSSLLQIQSIQYLWIENDEEVMTLSGATEELGIAAINDYFERHNTPLAGYGEIFIRVSQKYRLDWRLLPAIAFKESTGGKFLFRPYNPFGWGRASFSSFEEAIEVVGKNLAGENPRTAGFYKGKSIKGKLHYYNSELEEYTDIIFWIMRDIEKYTHDLGGP